MMIWVPPPTLYQFRTVPVSDRFYPKLRLKGVELAGSTFLLYSSQV